MQETHVVFREQAEIGYLVFQVCNPFYSKTESVTAVNFAVYAAELKYIGVNHTATKYFHPSSMFTETTAFSATDMARDVHFGTWFGEREVTRTQTDLCIRPE